MNTEDMIKRLDGNLRGDLWSDEVLDEAKRLLLGFLQFHKFEITAMIPTASRSISFKLQNGWVVEVDPCDDGGANTFILDTEYLRRKYE